MNTRATILFISMALLAATMATAQPAANYSEDAVPAYTLPDPLVSEAGTRITTKEQWKASRRPEILRLFEEKVYGHAPGKPEGLRFETLSEDRHALNGKAVRKQVRVHFSRTPGGPAMDLLIYLPAAAHGAVPVFVGLNFDGNHTVQNDPEILLPESWVSDGDDTGAVGHRASESGRGASASRWPVDRILDRGYGVATAYYGDIDPDFDDGFKNGVHALYAAQPRTDASWGAIAAWAWGLRRALDYLVTDEDVDQRRVYVVGHSRLGKAALWAGVQDPRFAMVISNNSGAGGAALSRRIFGETVGTINKAFPHWFARNYRKYDGREQDLPVDQHQLLALVAPRPLYVASASEDLWADPKGEFLSATGANPVYRLFGLEGLPVDEMPGIEQPVAGTIGYHLREGKHDVTAYDWDRWMDFADRHFPR